jgi:hypothetical protein
LREAIIASLREVELPLDRGWITRTERLARKLDATDPRGLHALVDLLARKLPVAEETVRHNRELVGRELEWAGRWPQPGHVPDGGNPQQDMARWLREQLPVEARFQSLSLEPDGTDEATPRPDRTPEGDSARLARDLRCLGDPPEWNVPWSDRDGNVGWLRIRDESPENEPSTLESSTSIRMTLETPHLSRVGIDLQFRAGLVTLQIDLTDGESARWLEPRLQELRDSLEARGFAVRGPSVRLKRAHVEPGDTRTTRWG